MGEPPPSEAKDLFGIKTRWIAACADLSDSELAELLGAEVEVVLALRYRGAEVTIDHVLRVCRGRAVSPLWMLAGLGPPEEPRLRDFLAGGERSPPD